MTGRPSALTEASTSANLTGQGYDVWFADLGRDLEAIEDEERRCPRLSPDELVRAERMDGLDRRRLWRASHIALRDILERCFGPALRRVPFDFKVGGRPELAPGLAPGLAPELVTGVANTVGDPAVSFSLSHTADVALIGISRAGPVGVDIEAIHARAFPQERRRKIEAIALAIAGGRPLPDDADRRFLQAWTRVEALSKADGRGVLHTLGSPGILPARSADAAALEGNEASRPQFDVRDLQLGQGFCASVAGAGLPEHLAVKPYVPPRNQPL